MFFVASWTHLEREVIRFLRQRDRVIGALGTPLLFWFLIGSGLGKSFRAPAAVGVEGLNYLQYFFAGTLLLMILFTAIFSAFSVIEDRKAGFLQAVLVSPSPRAGLVMGKLLGGTALALLQAGLLLLLAPLLDVRLTWSGAVETAVVLALVSFGLTGVGFLGAMFFDSMQGFHAVMNLVLMPLWFLSGALFPVDGAPRWLAFLMKGNPLTQALDLLQGALFPGVWPGTAGEGALAYTAAFAVLTFFGCLWAANRRN